MITDLYEPVGAIEPLGNHVGVGQLAAPPGFDTAGATGLELFDNLIEQLQLPTLGVYSPWAAREAMDWKVVRQPPETNVVVAGLNDALWQGAQTLSFGAPLPWIGIFTERLPTEDDINRALSSTPYQLFHTQAVYDQADAAEPPTIRFLTWARLREQGPALSSNASLDAAAAALNGRLVFAVQVLYDTSKRREPPAMPFMDALNAQFGILPPGVDPPGPLPPGVDPPGPLPPAPPTEAASWKPYAVPMVATAIVFAVGGYFAVKTMRTPRKGR